MKMRYTCGGCGYRWARDFEVPAKIAGKVPAELSYTVPADVSPCCGDAANDEVES